MAFARRAGIQQAARAAASVRLATTTYVTASPGARWLTACDITAYSSCAASATAAMATAANSPLSSRLVECCRVGTTPHG